MTQPAVTITESDGSLGVLPPSSGKLYALVGCSSSGAVATPSTYARVKDVVTAFVSGPLVEAACHYIDRYAKPVLIVRAAAAAASWSVAAVVTLNAAGTAVATGTSVVAVQASPTPDDDYEIVLKIVVGGTRGTAGITYQLSLDG